MKKAIRLLATAGGVGYIPYGPGTFGTLWGIPLFYFLHGISVFPYFAFLICFIAAASCICELASLDFNTIDDKRIVLDEVVGYMVALFTFEFTWIYIILSFVLFRLFDILKPFPIHYVDTKFKSGFGVVLDDVLAGIYANLTLQVVSLFL